MTQKIDISTSSYVRLILILLGIWLLFMVRDIIALLFIVFIIVAWLDPAAKKWSRYLTRPGAVIALFVIIFAVIALAGYILLPPLGEELQQFASHLPGYVTSAANGSHGTLIQQTTNLVTKNISSLTGQLGGISNIIVQKTIGALDIFVAFITVLVLAFYLLVDEKSWRNLYKGILPPDMYENLGETTHKITDKLGAWVRGQLWLMLSVAVLTFIGLEVVRTPYALALSCFAGLLAIIPIVGPWITTIVATLIGFAISPIHGLLTLLIFGIVQEFEGHYLVPKVVGQAVGLNPVFVIIALLIGATLYGITGALLSVPVAAIVSVIVEDWTQIKETFTTSRS